MELDCFVGFSRSDALLMVIASAFIEAIHSVLTLKTFDEVFLEWQELRNPSNKYVKHTHRLVKKMFKYYKNEKGQTRAIMAVIEYQKDKTHGASIYYLDDKSASKRRTGKIIYKR